MSSVFDYKEPNLHLGLLSDAAPDRSRFGMHTHQKLEIFCFLKGRGVFYIEGSEYPLEPGDVLI